MPLNQTLFSKIESRLGRVVIQNEGEAMDLTYVNEPGGKTGLRIESYGETYKADCPFCNDKRGRLSICHRFGSRDLVTGRDMDFVVKCHHEDCLTNSAARIKLIMLVFGRAAAGHAAVITKGTTAVKRVPVLPGPCHTLDKLLDDHPAKLYIKSRGYDADVLGKVLKVAYCPEASCDDFAQAANRIIIPFFMNGKLVGWQARYIGDRPKEFFKEFDISKYFTMPGMDRNSALYNYDIAKNCSYGIVTEGPSDVWSIGRPAVCVMGHSVGQRQTQLIASAWGNGVVVILLDEDARDSAYDLAVVLEKVVKKVVVAVPPVGSDPGSMSRSAVWGLVDKACLDAGVDLATESRIGKASLRHCTGV